MYSRDQKIVCEALQAIRDTSVANHLQAHVRKVLQSVVTNQVVNM